MRLARKVICPGSTIGIVMLLTGNCLMHFKDRIDLDTAPELFDLQMKMYDTGIAIRNISIPVCLVMFIALVVVWIARLIGKT